MLKKPVFQCKIKTSYKYFFYFSQFHEQIFKRSCSQMLFKIGALKILQYSELKRDSNTGVFPSVFRILRSFKKNSFFIAHLRWLLLYFLKEIKQACYDVAALL